MKKDSTKRIIELLPEVVKNSFEWLKSHLEKNAKDVVENSAGTVAIIIKLFAQPMIDGYFKKLSENKLKDFGSYSYANAALKQAIKSLDTIKGDVQNEIGIPDLLTAFKRSIDLKVNGFDPANVLLIFQPKYHPIVVLVKETYVTLLESLKINPNYTNSFKRDFNENIEVTVAEEFGEDYESHLAEIGAFTLKKNETDLLWDAVQLGKIGFNESENLKYETTFAEWKEVSKLKAIEEKEFNEDEKKPLDEIEKQELSLKNIESLIEEYFNVDSSHNLEKILFIIADFGKGKSVFLKHYAATLAKSYLETFEGFIPIYFNLRNFHNYSSNSRLGVIDDFLRSKYAIQIDSDYFETKKYIFLIDSLDESGELSKHSVENVIESVKQIQNIDKTKFRTNRLIITSRPFDDGLTSQLTAHSPYIMKGDHGRDNAYYVAVHGFKKQQFNDWLITTLKNLNLDTSKFQQEFVLDLLTKIKTNQPVDIYAELLSKNTLSASELRRPIFAYMIYQLIKNNIDFLKVGKIGVYLSFLNLLSKEAKHIDDPSHKVHLREEFEFRNILHAIASLWMFERDQGKQGSLKKADICRVLDGKSEGETDAQILERYKDQNVNEIQFLSHSYFGENDNKLHFQHQSFAEILLAEYYLKVFIKFSLDEQLDVEQARTKLVLGAPTQQTINFLIELLQLLKDCAPIKPSDDTLEKRKLLFPLLASIATKKNNNLFSTSLFYQWFKKYDIQEDDLQYPEILITDWFLKQSEIDKILNLSKSILNSESKYFISKTTRKTALFENELTMVHNYQATDQNLEIDRWLALLVGDKLYTDTNNPSSVKLFNTDYKINFRSLINLLVNTNLKGSNRERTPPWATPLFRGIDMSQNTQRIEMYSILNFVDLSYSFLKNLSLTGCLLGSTLFDNCRFSDVQISHSYMWGTSFKNLILLDNNGAEYCVINNTIFPFDIFKPERRQFSTLNKHVYITKPVEEPGRADIMLKDIYSDTRRIINELFISMLKDNREKLSEFENKFIFQNENDKLDFFELVNSKS